MLRPSYSELMEVIARSGRLDRRVASRYTVVQAAAKRARQITEGANPLTYAPTDRAVSIAIKEMAEGKLRINVKSDLMEEKLIRHLKDDSRIRHMSMISKDDLEEALKVDYGPSVSIDSDVSDVYDAEMVHGDAMLGLNYDDMDADVHEDEDELDFSVED